MSIEARNRPLHHWFERIRAGQLALPRFQRFEAWSHANVVQLFNTILRDLPIGAALVLEVGDEEPFLSRPLQGSPDTAERVIEHLLDGQQRLTALWRGLHNNYDDRTYFVSFTPDEESVCRIMLRPSRGGNGMAIRRDVLFGLTTQRNNGAAGSCRWTCSVLSSKRCRRTRHGVKLLSKNPMSVSKSL